MSCSDSADTSRKADLHCSFCGKSQSEVSKIVAGPTVYICDECIILCMEIIDEAGIVEQSDVIKGPVGSSKLARLATFEFHSLDELLEEGGFEKSHMSYNGRDVFLAVCQALELRLKNQSDAEKSVARATELREQIDSRRKEALRALEEELLPLEEELQGLQAKTG